MPLILPPLYPITPENLRGSALLAWAADLMDSGCGLLQYRRKDGPDGERLRDLEALLGLVRPRGGRIIVDDRVDLCLLADADGVHLGQDDMAPAEARQMLGAGKVIGLSTHSLRQVEDALDEPVDYLALGPVFPTATKANPDAVVTPDIQEAAIAHSPFPLVAIGGITPGTARDLWARGFASLAVIGALSRNPGDVWRAFMAASPGTGASGT